jgi:hypothetical protein
MFQQTNPNDPLLAPLVAPPEMTSRAWTERKASLARSLRGCLNPTPLGAVSWLQGVPDDVVIRAYAMAAGLAASPASERTLARLIRDARDADEFRLLLVCPAVPFHVHEGKPVVGRGRYGRLGS